MVIDLENSTRAKIITSVLGQLSDGMWENSSAMDKYWKYAKVEGTQLILKTDTYKSGFYNKTEEWIKNWFANKLKQAVQDEHGNNKAGWNRMNTAISDYISYSHDITVSMCYECYDFLKGRKGHKYGHSSSDDTNDLDKFKKFLSSTITGYLEDCDFENTSELTEWLNSVVKYFSDHFALLSKDGFNNATFEFMKDSVNLEVHEIDWPKEPACSVILNKSFRNSNSYYDSITEELGYVMNLANCFRAEYLCKNGIRDLIYNAIEKYFTEGKVF